MKEGCSLLVRNLRFETSPAKLRRIFEEFGQVRDVYLPVDHHNKKPRGFGFVEFYNERDARESQRSLDRTKIDGNEVNIIIAQDRRKSPESMRRITEDASRYRRHRGDSGHGGEYGGVGSHGDRSSYRDRSPRYGRYRSGSPVRDRSPPYDRSHHRYHSPRDSPPRSVSRDRHRRGSRAQRYSRSNSRSPSRRRGGSHHYI